MYLKVHEAEGKRIVAACDEELIGRVFEEGERVLDLKTYASFYKGRKATREEVADALKDADFANLVGEEAVGVAISLGLASNEDVMRIAGVPHLHIYRV